jgi:hypothetical protein
MASEAQQIRQLIEASIDARGNASLVEVIAKYDFKNHAIPSTKQMNRALAGLALALDRTDTDVLLRRSEAVVEPRTLSDGDMQLIYAHYTRALRSRRRRGV